MGKKSNKTKKRVKKTSKVEVNNYSPEPSFWKNNWLLALVIFILPFTLYWSSLEFDYVLDDKIVLSENKFVKKGADGIPDLLTKGTFEGYELYNVKENPLAGGRYRPLSLVMFALEYEWFASENAAKTTLQDETKLKAVNHFVNILLYALTGVLIFWLISLLIGNDKKLFWRIGIPFVAALLFILHPVHTEAVANVKGRDEILAALLSFLSLLLSYKYLLSRKLWLGILGALVFFLAILAKENSITFLVIIPMAAYFFSGRDLKGALNGSVPIFIATALYFLFRITVVGDLFEGGDSELSDSILNNPFAEASASEKYATIFLTLGKYLLLLFLPITLTHDYYPLQIPIISWGDYRAIVPLLLYGGLAFLAVKQLKRKTILSFSIWFFLGTIIITSNLIVGVGTFMNERFLFLPSFAFCLLIAYFLVEKLPSFAKSSEGKSMSLLSAILVLALVGGYAFKTIDRVPDWKSSLSLNISAVAASPNSIRANQFYAYDLYLSGREETDKERKAQLFEEALTHVNKALSMYPTYNQSLICKAGLVAEVYQLDKDLTKLLNEFYSIQTVRVTPFVDQYLAYIQARVDKATLATFYQATGDALVKQGNTNKGQEYLQKAKQLSL